MSRARFERATYGLKGHGHGQSKFGATTNPAKTSENHPQDANPRLDRALTKTYENYPELAKLIDAWPSLSEQVRATIVALAEAKEV